MIEITSFLLKHLYELMADNYNSNFNYNQQQQEQHQQQQQTTEANNTNQSGRRRRRSRQQSNWLTSENCRSQSPASASNPVSVSSSRERLQQFREQETNQQIVSFLTNNQLPDLACETFIELLFICVFLAVSWVFVMIVQLHYTASHASSSNHQQHYPSSHQPSRSFYCQTSFVNSLMYCNNQQAHSLAY